MVENAERNVERLKALHKELKLKTLLILLGAVISAATEVFFILGAPRYGFADEMVLLGNLVFIVTILKVFSDVKEEIEAKYMLE